MSSHVTTIRHNGRGVDKLFKGVQTKLLKPFGKTAVISTGKVSEFSRHLGSGVASRSFKALAFPGKRAVNFSATGKCMRIGEETIGTSLYFPQKKQLHQRNF